MDPAQRKQIMVEAKVEQLFFISHGAHVGRSLQSNGININQSSMRICPSAYILLRDDKRRDLQVRATLHISSIKVYADIAPESESPYQYSCENPARFNSVRTSIGVGCCKLRELGDDAGRNFKHTALPARKQ